MRIVRMLRRALAAIGAAGLVAAAVRLRGGSAVPPQTGGWREVDPSELD
jgi:hypothetical protein